MRARVGSHERHRGDRAESPERRFAIIYGELRALVQPAGTWNDAPLARRAELALEAADLRRKYDLRDPGDMRRDPPDLIAELLRRQGAYFVEPSFAIALIVAVLWLALGLAWLVSALRDPGVMSVPPGVTGLTSAPRPADRLGRVVRATFPSKSQR